jgi:hypothetical protein
MTRSVARSTMRGGAARLALLIGAVALLAAGTAEARRKKAADADAAEANPDSPSVQVGDTEKPKAMVDVGQPPPKADALGHVHFASPNGEGLGRVAVSANPDDKIKVFLEGRYFGTAPVTIYSVPKGDYIIEATYPTGKQVSKPVTVAENEEAVVDLGGAKALGVSEKPGLFASNPEMTPGRTMWFKVFCVTAGVGAVAAITFGLLEMKAESDYNNYHGTDQAKIDDLNNKGQRYALLTNVGLAVFGVGAIGAVVTGYPLVFKSSEQKTEKKMALTVTPALTPTMTGGFATLTF